jgi:hypothetical protein
VAKDEHQRHFDDLPGAVRVGQPPGYAGQEQEEGEQVGEAGVGTVPGVFGLFLCWGESCGLPGSVVEELTW